MHIPIYVIGRQEAEHPIVSWVQPHEYGREHAHDRDKILMSGLKSFVNIKQEGIMIAISYLDTFGKASCAARVAYQSRFVSISSVKVGFFLETTNIKEI